MKNRNKKGFTIVELVIVIGVIGILSAILIPTFANLTNEANKARAVAEVQGAYSLYIQDAVDQKLHEAEGDAQLDLPVTDQLAQNQVAIKRGNLWYTYGATGWTGDEEKPTNVTEETEDPVTAVANYKDYLGEYNNCKVYDNR